MSMKKALIISAVLLAAYALCLTVSALSFMPQTGVRAAVDSTASEAAELTGGDDGSRAPQELLPDERININTSDGAELERLPGIGPALAEAVIAYRASNGSFARIEDIMEVDGIGESRFAAIRENITVEEGTDEDSGS